MYNIILKKHINCLPNQYYHILQIINYNYSRNVDILKLNKRNISAKPVVKAKINAFDDWKKESNSFDALFKKINSKYLAQSKIESLLQKRIEIQNRLVKTEDTEKLKLQEFLIYKAELKKINDNIARWDRSSFYYQTLVEDEIKLQEKYKETSLLLQNLEHEIKDLRSSLFETGILINNEQNRHENFVRNLIAGLVILGAVLGYVRLRVEKTININHKKNIDDLIRETEIKKESWNAYITRHSVSWYRHFIPKTDEATKESWNGYIKRQTVSWYRYFIPKS